MDARRIDKNRQRFGRCCQRNKRVEWVVWRWEATVLEWPMWPSKEDGRCAWQNPNSRRQFSWSGWRTWSSMAGLQDSTCCWDNWRNNFGLPRPCKCNSSDWGCCHANSVGWTGFWIRWGCHKHRDNLCRGLHKLLCNQEGWKTLGGSYRKHQRSYYDCT